MFYWKCLIVSKTSVRTKLKFYPFEGNWGLISIFGPTGPKFKKGHKFRHCGLLRVLNTLLALCYSRGKDYDKKPMFLKYKFCKISYLCILGQKCLQKLFIVFTISLDFQNMYIFFKTFC